MAATRFVWRWQMEGGYVHVDVYTGEPDEHILKGHIRLSPAEWDDLRLMLTPHSNRNAVTYAGSRPQAVVEQEERGEATADQVADKGAGGMLGNTILCIVCGAWSPVQARCPQCGALL